MKIGLMFLVCLIGFSSSATADYKSGWDFMNFYKKVETCRESIVFPQIKSYGKRGKEKGQDEQSLKNEMIAISPVMDRLATATCFCTYNEIAKDNTFDEYKKGVDLESYMGTPRCKKVMERSIKSLKQMTDELKLK